MILTIACCNVSGRRLLNSLPSSGFFTMKLIIASVSGISRRAR